MRRPAAACAAGFTAGIAVYEAAGPFLFVALSAGFLLFYLLIKCNKIENKEINSKNICSEADQTASAYRRVFRRTVPVLLIFFIAGGMRYAAFSVVSSGFSCYDGEEAQLSGRVISEERKEEKLILIIRTDCGDGVRGEKLLVTVRQKGGDAAEGEIKNYTGWQVNVSGVFSEPKSAGNPKAFDYRKYLESRGIRMTVYADSGGLSAEKAPGGVYLLLAELASIKDGYIAAVSEYMSEKEAGLLFGIMFGDRSDLDESVYEEFQKNGTAHLLAVSGLHISLIYGILNAVFRRPTTLAGNLPTAAVLVMYTALSGFSPSVVRAVFMIFVHIAARISHRRYDFLSCVSFCALTLLVYRPSFLFSAGFQLSFLAVLTISIVMPHAERVSGILTERVERADGSSKLQPEAEQMTSVSVLHSSIFSAVFSEKRRSAYRAACRMRVKKIQIQAAGIVLMQAGMMPMTLYHFHYISIAAFFLNPLAIALAGVIVPAGAALIPVSLLMQGTLFPMVPQAASDVLEAGFSFLCKVTQILLELLIGINDFAAGTPLSYRYAASPPDGVFLFYYAALFFFCSEAGKSFLSHLKAQERAAAVKKLTALIVTAALICGVTGLYVQRTEIASDLIFVDVGQGDCAHLKADGGMDLMFDSGGSDTYDVGKNILIPYFLGNGVSDIDLAVISHLHQDHCGGLETVTQGVKVKKIMLSAVYRSQAAQISQRFQVSESDLLFVQAGDTVEIGGAVLDVLAPKAADDDTYRRILENSDDENELCLIVRAEYKGTSVLFTGDIGADYEKALVGEWENESGSGRHSALKSDILKTAHHGSRYSTCDAFLSAVRPSAAVIQVGTNYYGHPSKEVISRLLENGVSVYRNDEDGAVFVKMGKRLRMATMR